MHPGAAVTEAATGSHFAPDDCDGALIQQASGGGKELLVLERNVLGIQRSKRTQVSEECAQIVGVQPTILEPPAANAIDALMHFLGRAVFALKSLGAIKQWLHIIARE